MDTRDRTLNKAKIGLMDPSNKTASPVFYSSILFSLKLQWTDSSSPIKTAGVDGTNLFINPDWFCKLQPRECVGLLAHEALHIAYRHIDYFEQYNRKKFSRATEHMLWNKAGDHVINLGLLKGGYTLPPNGLHDERFKDKSTLQVYRVLHDECKPNTPDPDLGDCDILMPSSDGSAKSARVVADLRAKITDIITRAAVTSKLSGEDPGKIPAGIIRGLEEVLNPQLPFELILANYMNAYAKDDYSFSRPNRRFLPDVIIPGAHSERLTNIACAFDVSGSVSKKQLSSYVQGLRMMMEQLKPEKITLIEFDTSINGVRELTDVEDINDVKFTGGGGTLINPVMDWVKTNAPVVTLVFTDGCFAHPSIIPDSDIIWIIDDNKRFTCNFGQIIHYTI